MQPSHPRGAAGQAPQSIDNMIYVTLRPGRVAHPLPTRDIGAGHPWEQTLEAGYDTNSSRQHVHAVAQTPPGHLDAAAGGAVSDRDARGVRPGRYGLPHVPIDLSRPDGPDGCDGCDGSPGVVR